jgi:hypothetical protein
MVDVLYWVNIPAGRCERCELGEPQVEHVRIRQSLAVGGILQKRRETHRLGIDRHGLRTAFEGG